MSGSHGSSMVVTTLPLLLPRPQVGQARSFIVSGAKMPVPSRIRPDSSN